MASKTKSAQVVSARGAAPAVKKTTSKTALPLWAYFVIGLSVFYALLQVYAPALRAPFVFDDRFLPYTDPHFATIPLRNWLGVRPVLGLSFWMDSHLWGQNTLPFHLVNLALHLGSGGILFLIFRKLLTFANTAEPRKTTLAVFGAALFLFHPIQSEVAAYTASRSEALSVLFFLAAFCMFLYRKQAAIGWRDSVAVLVLFGLALGSKEHTVTLPALLLLTDWFWNPQGPIAGIRANLRLYGPIILLGLLGVTFVFRYIGSDPMIGFHIEGLGPGAYFLTECRVILKYVQLFVFPYSQNVDYDFPVSHTLTEHGALIALGALLFVAAAALLFRKEYPFASYGILAFLLLLSPTSSVIPINDVLVERRLYLPFLALMLVLFEPLRRVRVRQRQLSTALAAIVALAAFFTWQRAHVWEGPTLLFADAAAKSPGKARVHIGYANALYHERRCREALEEYGIASRLKTTDYILYYNLGAAYDCINSPDDAVGMLVRSNSLKPQPNTYTMIGKIQGQQGKLEASLASLNAALSIDPTYPAAHAYRGAVYASMGKPDAAQDEYREALRHDPSNQVALQGLAALRPQR